MVPLTAAGLRSTPSMAMTVLASDRIVLSADAGIEELPHVHVRATSASAQRDASITIVSVR
jgi:hypothetical protein